MDNITKDGLDFDIYPGFQGVYNASAPRPLEKRLEKRYENTYEAIRPDKQQWLFMRADPQQTPVWKNVEFDPATGKNKYSGDGPIQPDRKKNQHSGNNTFYLVSAAHLWNMKARCIYPQASYEFTFTANNTGVTILDHCVWANRSQLWEVTLWKPADFKQGIAPNPAFAQPPPRSPSSPFAIWDKSPVIWWAVLVVLSFFIWIL